MCSFKLGMAGDQGMPKPSPPVCPENQLKSHYHSNPFLANKSYTASTCDFRCFVGMCLKSKALVLCYFDSKHSYELTTVKPAFLGLEKVLREKRFWTVVLMQWIELIFSKF